MMIGRKRRSNQLSRFDWVIIVTSEPQCIDWEWMERFLKMDGHVIAGVTAVASALVLHLSHIVEEDVVFTIVLSCLHSSG